MPALRIGMAGREQDLAARLREAWEALRSRTLSDTVAEPGQTPEPESAHSPAERPREAAQGIDRGTLAKAAARLQEGREAERMKEQERQREQGREVRHRDRGMDHGV